MKQNSSLPVAEFARIRVLRVQKTRILANSATGSELFCFIPKSPQ